MKFERFPEKYDELITRVVYVIAAIAIWALIALYVIKANS